MWNRQDSSLADVSTVSMFYISSQLASLVEYISPHIPFPPWLHLHLRYTHFLNYICSHFKSLQRLAKDLMSPVVHCDLEKCWSWFCLHLYISFIQGTKWNADSKAHLHKIYDRLTWGLEIWFTEHGTILMQAISRQDLVKHWCAHREWALSHPNWVWILAPS